jgi:hypothetical protein
MYYAALARGAELLTADPQLALWATDITVGVAD